MKHHQKRKGMKNAAPRCPYCGSHTVLRSADGIYVDNSRETMLYVCKNYPACDAYVRVQPGTTIPLGTVANRELRAMRAEAHRHFNQLFKYGFMTKHDAYQWLAGILNVSRDQAHIGCLNEITCEYVTREAKKLVAWYQEKQREKNCRLWKGGAMAS